MSLPLSLLPSPPAISTKLNEGDGCVHATGTCLPCRPSGRGHEAGQAARRAHTGMYIHVTTVTLGLGLRLFGLGWLLAESLLCYAIPV